jgi:PAS domain-containing protein
VSEETGLLPPTLDGDPIRRALDCLEEGFQIIGFDWTYIYLNPAAARHGRRLAHQLVGKPMIDAYPGIEDTPLFDVLHRCMEERTGHVFENEFTFPDGSTRWFELRVQPVPEGICVYSSDIDRRKRRELAHENANQQGAGSQTLIHRLVRLFRRDRGAPGAGMS